jgi:hypothetical protein
VSGQNLSHRGSGARPEPHARGSCRGAEQEGQGQAGGYGPNGQSQSAHDKFASSVEDIVRIATPWAKHLSRAQIVKKLTKGRPALSAPVG